MRNILALSFLFCATAFANAGETPDYSDPQWSCDKKLITYELEELIKDSPFGVAYGLRLLYVKGEPVETSRSKNELRCRVVIVTNRGSTTSTGIFRFYNEEGHSLAGWQGNRER